MDTQPEMTAEICYKQKPDYCPTSSYKQCTNNYIPATPCQCEERSYELCPVHQRVNQKMFQSVYNPFKNSLYLKHIPENRESIYIKAILLDLTNYNL